MEKRFVLFLVLSLGILMAHAYLTALLQPPVDVADVEGDKKRADQGAAEQDTEGEAKDQQVSEDSAEPRQGEATIAATADGNEAPPQHEPSWATLGSGDPDSPYRLLAYFHSKGAALVAAELNSRRFRDLEYRSGHLGYLAPTNVEDGEGCQVRTVGPGTPAERAGVRVGDLIVMADSKPITSTLDLESALRATSPGETIPLELIRDGRRVEVQAILTRQPLLVIRPEANSQESTAAELEMGEHDRLSLLATVGTDDNGRLDTALKTLGGVDPLNDHWELLSADESEVVFELQVPRLQLRLVKRFRIDSLPPEQAEDITYPAYHLWVDLEIHNESDAEQTVGYRLQGPTGLPVEGWWYANKISRSWGAAGLRDVALLYQGHQPELVTRSTIVEEQSVRKESADPLIYMGVDAQYFAAVLIPQRDDPTEKWIEQAVLSPVGAVLDEREASRTNVSFELTSEFAHVAPNNVHRHTYQLFLGPKKPDLLATYGPAEANGLGSLVYYGWFGWVAQPMLWLLHTFYAVVRNYGLAIIMLTVVVRGCMYPLSQKQARAAQKMQELQPEMKRIAEKYKSNLEMRTKAQQELFRKHNYNPLGGCGLVFIQLPIFIGLYRSLMVDVELRQAPLISESIRWCSNLSAPDMLFYWEPYLPAFLASPTGFLGPYLNVLPLVTVALFLWQTKMFTPPPTDEQTRMQARVMKFMTLFMGFLFFKVASGLCIYFTASSIWGIAERKLLPKTRGPENRIAEAPAEKRPKRKPSSNGNPQSRGGAAQKSKRR